MMIYAPLNNWLQGLGLNSAMIQLVDGILGLMALLLIAITATIINNLIFAKVVAPLISHSRTKWDDTLAANRFFHRLLLLVPLCLCYLASGLLFQFSASATLWIHRLLLALLVVIVIRTIDAASQATDRIYSQSAMAQARPIRGYLTALRIICYVLAAIFIIAIIADKSPWGVVSIFGGLTAVLLLIFKDSIMGFVANLLLTGSNMIQVGDWIEVPKFQADGDVIDISLHTVQVQNWDKTISAIPSYALVSQGFKNWRGMAESGGRRIKRAIYLDMAAIRFCSPALLEHLETITLLQPYLAAKRNEIAEDNRSRPDQSQNPANLRQQTNIGIFRAYVEAYLRQHQEISSEFTFLIRQLAPTAQGLPLEIYAFCRDIRWARYEAIQADIFDHLLAIIPEFELRVFQYPSGQDLQKSQTGSAGNLASTLPGVNP
ncbi:MAG: mechanosensitive ion channel domain-containing protein [Thermodesulfobacteriota bacterium]